jgi:hypothetical protein
LLGLSEWSRTKRPNRQQESLGEFEKNPFLLQPPPNLLRLESVEEATFAKLFLQSRKAQDKNGSWYCMWEIAGRFESLKSLKVYC